MGVHARPGATLAKNFGMCCPSRRHIPHVDGIGLVFRARRLLHAARRHNRPGSRLSRRSEFHRWSCE